jgi:hypothetical protein
MNPWFLFGHFEWCIHTMIHVGCNTQGSCNGMNTQSLAPTHELLRQSHTVVLLGPWETGHTITPLNYTDLQLQRVLNSLIQLACISMELDKSITNRNTLFNKQYQNELMGRRQNTLQWERGGAVVE